MAEVGMLDDISHRRFNPLAGTWILVSPHRNKRPWQGIQETPAKTTLPEYDPNCFFCPGNKRASGTQMPEYTSTYIFINDYSAVKELQPCNQRIHSHDKEDDPESFLFQAQGVTGRCYVINFSPAHNVTLADLPYTEIRAIIEAWTYLYTSHLPPIHSDYAPLPTSLSSETSPPTEQYSYLQIFENKGSTMGCSNPHPHGQAWCTSFIPSEVSTEIKNFQAYKLAHNGRGLLTDYIFLELTKRERLIYDNETWVAVCPWWATWPFETLLAPKREVPSLVGLTEQERNDLADVISQVVTRYDNLFETMFPYSMGLHQAPLITHPTTTGSRPYTTSLIPPSTSCDSHLHLHFYPPLLRSATVKKFLVGYEMLAEAQRDITPEMAASMLRAVNGEVVYRKRL